MKLILNNLIYIVGNIDAKNKLSSKSKNSVLCVIISRIFFINYA